MVPVTESMVIVGAALSDVTVSSAGTLATFLLPAVSMNAVSATIAAVITPPASAAMPVHVTRYSCSVAVSVAAALKAATGLDTSPSPTVPHPTRSREAQTRAPVVRAESSVTVIVNVMSPDTGTKPASLLSVTDWNVLASARVDPAMIATVGAIVSCTMLQSSPVQPVPTQVDAVLSLVAWSVKPAAAIPSTTAAVAPARSAFVHTTVSTHDVKPVQSAGA